MSQCRLEHTIGDMSTRVKTSCVTSDTRDDDTEDTMGVQLRLQ